MTYNDDTSPKDSLESIEPIAPANPKNGKPADDDSTLSSEQAVTSNEESEPADAEQTEGSATLAEALAKYQIVLPEEKVALVEKYCELLWTWNERLNLTRHTTYDKFVSRDLYDAVRLASLLQSGERVLDVGSGGGAPGMLVAILRPDVKIDLCEATGKKATALGDMAENLGLDVNVWYAKAEDLLTNHRFHTLTIRAVGRIRYLLLMLANSWNSFHRMLLVKGPHWVDERGEARHYNMFNTLALRKLDEYSLPGDDHNSVILQICRKDLFEDLQQRAEDLKKGVPFREEEHEYDQIKPQTAPRRQGRGHSGDRSGSSRLQGRSGKAGQGRASQGTRTSSHRAKGLGDSAASSAPSGIHARANGKPPKGWTGKKREFRERYGQSESKASKPSRGNFRNSNSKRSSK
ncbi:MAG: 16S rRNA (guanine(527)-N(7))-methyltransferase RsmG [Planctomycetia bacterium]|nr:16S rRNA (guanine(527)-N(7))-methyltransferase RsmG [Planctomycetia bacterium]